MATKPILFNTEMVRAILDGRKTVTRRVVKLKYSNTHHEMRTDKYGTRLIELQNEEPGVTTVKNPDGTTTHRVLAYIEPQPPYKPGDILYVRETWNGIRIGNGNIGYQTAYWYKADVDDRDANPDDRWRPSIHMPKEAARIFLRVTDVRVERLQEIECISVEGITMIPADNDRDPRFYFIQLWDSTVKPADLDRYGWAANPWVWVIEFERISREEETENG